MLQDYFDLSGKNVLITGATQGIGAAIAKGLAGAGARLLINARNKDKLDAFIKVLGEEGISDATACLFDVTDREAIEKGVLQIEKDIGPIDVLVNNAGIIRRDNAEDFDEDDWELVIKTNLTAPFIMSKYVGRQMIKRKKGKIINIASLMSEVGRETVSAYAASKGGIKMLTKNLAAEWGRYNIQVNAIGPGFIATPINESYRAPGNSLNKYIISRTPAGRWGQPNDLAGAAIFLASKASDFVNGQVLYVDGGLLASFGNPNKK